MEQVTYQEDKVASFCTHSYQKSFTDVVTIPCKQNPKYPHKLSQLGKICNKCTSLIMKSVKTEQSCIICDGRLESYLQQNWICPHEDRQYDEVFIRCLAQKGEDHEIPLASEVCKKCIDKIKAAFLMGDKCRICEGEESKILNQLDKLVVSATYNYLNQVVQILKDKNLNADIFREEIELCCKAAPVPERKTKQVIPEQILEEYRNSDTQDNHESKRYKLFPKCSQHRNQPILLCNNCLVALLNLNICPYGCTVKLPESHAAKKEDKIKVFETGFLCMYLKKAQESEYLEMVVVRQIEEKGRLDRWEAAIRKIKPVNLASKDYGKYLPLYGCTVALGERTYMITGGLLGKQINTMTATNLAFMLQLSKDFKTFEIKETEPMQHKRASHASIFDASRRQLYVAGGFIKGEGCLKSCEMYSFQKQKWSQIADLNAERSKPSITVHQGSLYVFGGLSPKPEFENFMMEKYLPTENKWVCLAYDGFDFPFLTGAANTGELLKLQDNETLFIFGGSNNEVSTYLVQEMSLKQKQFSLSCDPSDSRLNHERVGCTLGMMNTPIADEKIIIAFGGLNEHENIISLDLVRARVTGKKINPIFVYDALSFGSMRLLSRQNSEKRYQRIYTQLADSGLMRQEKLESKQASITSPYSVQLIQQLWYNIGKSIVWIDFD